MKKNLDYEIFSLSSKEVKIIKKYEENEKEIIIEIKGKTIKHQCPVCHWYHTKRLWNKYKEHIVNHMFLSNYKTVKLKIYKREFVCLDCEKWKNKFRESFSFIDKNCSYTKTYKDFILTEWEYSSISELARKFKVSESMVYWVINGVSIEDLERAKITYLNTLKEIYIWVDEVSFKGHDYVCTITELKEKKVIWVLKSKSKLDLQLRLKKVPVNILRNIKWIATDMNATFKKTIQEHIAKKTWVKIEEVWAKWVADHYHIKQMFHKLIMEVYNMNTWMIKAWHYDWEIKNICDQDILNKNKYRIEDLPWIKKYETKNESYKPITLGFFLSKKYRNLLLTKKENLTEKQFDRLQQILCEFDPCWYMKQARDWKELLYEAMDQKSKTKIKQIIKSFRKSIHYKIETVWKTINKRKQEIFNYFEINITNAFTEWKNTKVKLFKRMAYGYNKKENYMKRLLLCL